MTIKRDVALTFAGGGNRAFYVMGLLAQWDDVLLPRTAVVASCSAGACVITTYLSGRRTEAREYWLSRVRGITRNFDWPKLLRGERAAPQGEIYRDTLLVTLSDDGLERIRQQPFPIYVLAASLPRWLPASLSAALGLGPYSAERSRERGPHPRDGRTRGRDPSRGARPLPHGLITDAAARRRPFRPSSRIARGAAPRCPSLGCRRRR